MVGASELPSRSGRKVSVQNSRAAACGVAWLVISDSHEHWLAVRPGAILARLPGALPRISRAMFPAQRPADAKRRTTRRGIAFTAPQQETLATRTPSGAWWPTNYAAKVQSRLRPSADKAPEHEVLAA